MTRINRDDSLDEMTINVMPDNNAMTNDNVSEIRADTNVIPDITDESSSEEDDTDEVDLEQKQYYVDNLRNRVQNFTPSQDFAFTHLILK